MEESGDLGVNIGDGLGLPLVGLKDLKELLINLGLILETVLYRHVLAVNL